MWSIPHRRIRTRLKVSINVWFLFFVIASLRAAASISTMPVIIITGFTRVCSKYKDVMRSRNPVEIRMNPVFSLKLISFCTLTPALIF